ncbi:MAG: hypothetical protein QW505_04100 [Thermoplasmata archaeon]
MTDRMAARKMVLLISGGIDSPVAGYLMGRQGIELTALSGFVNPIGDKEHIEKISGLIKQLSNVLDQQIPLYTFEHREALERFAKSPKHKLTCVLCKRMMLRVAERLNNRLDGSGIIMGDSLGQVASQTLQNLNVIEQAVAVPVIRPLIGLDKVDIVRIAEKIGTYQLSNTKSPGCAFLTARPVTKADLTEVLETEKALKAEKLTEKLEESLKRVSL